MPLETEDQNHLVAAEGYCDLGMFMDADAELDHITPEVRHVPEVLAVRLRIYQSLKNWELMETVARRLVDYDPDEPQWWISLAYATRRFITIDAAKSILLMAQMQHADEPMISFNLGCYECQLENLEVAKLHLKRAFSLNQNLRKLALEDEDLEPLWRSLDEISK